MVKLKRIYEEAELDDGFRVLVDRLWPRGISKERAKVDLWFKEIAPSDSLRKWFHHDLGKWEEFERKYLKELESKKELTEQLKELSTKKKNLTLLFGAKDTQHNQGVVLLNFLKK